jgi:hypothetical protein
MIVHTRDVQGQNNHDKAYEEDVVANIVLVITTINKVQKTMVFKNKEPHKNKIQLIGMRRRNFKNLLKPPFNKYKRNLPCN